VTVLHIALSVTVVFAAASLVAYGILKWVGVTQDLRVRAVKFGSSLVLISVLSQAAFTFFGAPIVGAFVTLLLSYAFVARVLDLSPVKNLLIIFLIFPFGVPLIAAPFILAINYTFG
jgi:hypothetical protein